MNCKYLKYLVIIYVSNFKMEPTTFILTVSLVFGFVFWNIKFQIQVGISLIINHILLFWISFIPQISFIAQEKCTDTAMWSGKGYIFTEEGLLIDLYDNLCRAWFPWTLKHSIHSYEEGWMTNNWKHEKWKMISLRINDGSLTIITRHNRNNKESCTLTWLGFYVWVTRTVDWNCAFIFWPPTPK